jgi:NADPH2 dehydrogenase
MIDLLSKLFHSILLQNGLDICYYLCQTNHLFGGIMEANLFSPGQVGPLTIKNRVVMPPMCMFAADQDGFPNEFHYAHYVSRAIHQVGLIIVEATGVSPEGRITDSDLGVWSDNHIEPLKHIVGTCHQFDARVLLQLAHAGRKCEVPGVTPLSASAIQVDDRYPIPHEMSIEEIKNFVGQMASAAERAVKAGFDGVEIHAAHGYLINQFLSPVTNHRTDEYGGSVENRSRLMREVVGAVNDVLPEDKALCVRVSGEEYLPEGLHPEDLSEMINLIPEGQVDAIHVSSGGLVNVHIAVFPGYQVPPAEKIKALTSLPVITGGMIHSPALANEIIANGRADFVFVGRGLLYDAAWVVKAQKTLGHEPQWPKPYAAALSRF